MTMSSVFYEEKFKDSVSNSTTTTTGSFAFAPFSSHNVAAYPIKDKQPKYVVGESYFASAGDPTREAQHNCSNDLIMRVKTSTTSGGEMSLPLCFMLLATSLFHGGFTLAEDSRVPQNVTANTLDPFRVLLNWILPPRGNVPDKGYPKEGITLSLELSYITPGMEPTKRICATAGVNIQEGINSSTTIERPATTATTTTKSTPAQTSTTAKTTTIIKNTGSTQTPTVARTTTITTNGESTPTSTIPTTESSTANPATTDSADSSTTPATTTTGGSTSAALATAALFASMALVLA
ncbi:hypothetical protein TSMEX_002676 [Taenia solium]|eukprot:TsM_001169600 transcript=TsM_001169600 gene=TsM_001169600